MASGIARAAGLGIGKSTASGAGAFGTLMGGGRKRGRIRDLESRVEALEGSNSEMEAEAPVAGAAAPSTQAQEAAATAQAMGGAAAGSIGGAIAGANESALIPTGRFSEQAQNTANSVFGTEEARKASLSQIPAGIASGNQETIGAIADLMNENV